MKRITCLFLTAVVMFALPVVAAEQLKNLPTASSARFDVADYTAWPSAHGDGHVCLWYGDKTAAVTITIDDNNDQDVSFWLDMQKKYAVSYTWFLITSKVNAWALWDLTVTRGSDAQSHTINHVSDGTDAVLRSEYGGSQSAINSMMKNGHRCWTLAYPNGTAHEDIAADYFIAARGTYGVMNSVDKINYLNVNSGGLDDKSRIDILLDPSQLLYGKSYHRGWLSVHYHNVTDKVATESYLAYIDSFKDSLWVTGFTNVAMYGQSRDSHTLTMGDVTPSSIKFTLNDRMADTIYTNPLTVKVRVNNDWTGVLAMQNGVQRGATFITHEGDNYVLVDAVPDAGEVTLTKAATGILFHQPVPAVGNRKQMMYTINGTPVSSTAVRPGMYLLRDAHGNLGPRLIIP